MGSKLVHNKWTGPCKVVEVVIEGLVVVIEMEGRTTRSRILCAASLKPFYTRPSDLPHPMENEFAQMAWGADLGLGGYSRLQQHQCTRCWTGGGWSPRPGSRDGSTAAGTSTGWCRTGSWMRSHWTASLRCSWMRFTRCGTCTIQAASRAAPQPETRGRGDAPRRVERGAEKVPDRHESHQAGRGRKGTLGAARAGL